MGWLNYITLLFVIPNIALGLMVLIKSRKFPLNLWFFIFTVDTSLWLLSNFYFQVVGHSLLVLRSQYTFGGLALICAFPWVWAFINYKPFIIEKLAVFIGAVVVIVLPLWDGLVISGLIHNASGSVDYASGPWFNYYGVFVFVLAGFLIGRLTTSYKRAKGLNKAQILYTLLGVLIFIVTSLVFATILPLFNIKPVIPVDAESSIIWVAFTTYAIIAYQLFDIRVIIRRTVVYTGLLIFTLGSYSMIVFAFSAIWGGKNAFDTRTFIANLIAATVIAIGFEPLRRWLTKATDRYLFKGEYDKQLILGDLSERMASALDLQQVAQTLVLLIKSQMRLTRTAMITFSPEEGRVVVKHVAQDGYNELSDVQLEPDNILLRQFSASPQVVIADVLKREVENKVSNDPSLAGIKEVSDEMERLQIALALPINVGKQAIGIFLVGDKLSGDSFTRDEVEFLQIVAHQAASAIEKSRFWEEDQMKSEFVSIASHELLTPTAAIKGYLSMILDDNMGQVDPQARKFLEKVAGSADRLARLVEDLLNVSRIESGRLKINKRAFSLGEMANKAVEELRVNATAKSLDLAYVPAAQELPNVYADADHIYRVLVNLIGNAIKYTPAGWVRVWVRPSDEGHLAFAVSDSGLGIPADNIPHLFEKFYRADRKEIAGIQGTGLGLYISKKIVEMMGGQLWVQSEENKGTTFFFTLPLATEEQLQAAPVVVAATQAASTEAGANATPQSAPQAPSVQTVSPTSASSVSTATPDEKAIATPMLGSHPAWNAASGGAVPDPHYEATGQRSTDVVPPTSAASPSATPTPAESKPTAPPIGGHLPMPAPRPAVASK